MSRPPNWLVAALFLVLTLVATYPIVVAPASYAYFGHSDAQLNMWIMAWETHALRHDPTNFFSGNIFFPEPRTIAYSETLLGYFPLYGLILAIGGPLALAFNAVLLTTFLASGFCMYLLTRHVTGRTWPAIVAGIVYAFVPYRFVHVPQIQLEAMEWMPLAFLFLHLFVEHGNVRHAIGLGAAAVLGTLCCVYYGVFLAVALGVAMVFLAIVDRRVIEPRKLTILAVVGCVAVLLLAPVLRQYVAVNRKLGLERSIREISERSADLSSYLSSTAPLHQALGRPLLPPPHDFLFPGAFALAFGVIGACTNARQRSAQLYAVIAVFGVLASLGPSGLYGLSPYQLLHAIGPMFRGLRQISRFGVVALFGLSVLVAFGCTTLERLLGRRRRAWQIAIAAIAFLELCPAPLSEDRPGGVPLVRVPETPGEYRWLTGQRGQFSVLELPLPDSPWLWRNAPYVYWSTVHWHPLLNGYSGFAPPAYSSLHRILSRFPDALSHDLLSRRGTRYVIVHWKDFTSLDSRQDPAELSRIPWLRLVAQFPGADVFEVRDR